MRPSIVEMAEATTMSANAPIVMSRKRNAAASLRNGFSTATASSEEVDRRVDDDPHDVDEVPVDPGQLDSVVMLRREVAAESADRHHQEEREPNRDMRAVEARQPEEDRCEGAVASVEPDIQVLDHLRRKEREAHDERQHHAGQEAGALATLDRLQRPVHGEARGHEDRGVDAGHEHREVVGLGGPLGRRARVDDSDEEVRGEERAEEHDLRPDEEEHPESPRIDAGALIGLGRSVMLMKRLGVGRHALTSTPASATTWSTGRALSPRSRPTRSRRSHPERSPGKVETMTSSVRSSSIASIAATNGSGWAICPWTSSPSARRIALRAHDQKARCPLLGSRPDAIEELFSENGLVRNDEDIRTGASDDVGDDVLDPSPTP